MFMGSYDTKKNVSLLIFDLVPQDFSDVINLNGIPRLSDFNTTLRQLT
jgi:hypothetical protein